MGAATVAHRVVIHGGYNGTELNDTQMLDMDSMTWTSISTRGPKVDRHPLSPFSSNRFLLVGGDRSRSKEVWIFDANDNTWKKREESLPDSMFFHRAVLTKTQKGLSVVCLGGNKDVKNMVVFDVE